MLTVVRAIRDVLLLWVLQFLSDKERRLMDAMRIGVLRVTTGAQLIDEAMRQRTMPK